MEAFFQNRINCLTFKQNKKMKRLVSFLPILLFVSSAGAKEKTYIASTPADAVVKNFLGIPLSDSVDFIRWKLVLQDSGYQLQCNYGIGKPNTNGFMNGGVTLTLAGPYRKEKNRYRFQNGTKTLKALELNTDLLHLLDADNRLLVGNGGWSYTLNNETPLGTSQVSITTTQTVLKDSIIFVGRTPCGIPGISAPGTWCYKLKWQLILYAGAQQDEPGRYKVLGTAWRKGGKKGNWRIIAGKSGQTTYRLDDDNGNGFLYLLKLDEPILLFTDAQGKLLVGDEDFSYTLNRK